MQKLQITKSYTFFDPMAQQKHIHQKMSLRPFRVSCFGFHHTGLCTMLVLLPFWGKLCYLDLHLSIKKTIPVCFLKEMMIIYGIVLLKA